MEGITDETQLLTEMKKHQQMTDALLGAMVEQRQKMHARMKEHHSQMRSRMEKGQQTAEQTPGCCDGGGAPASAQQTEEKESEAHKAHHNGE
jgi:hypothetical protein